MRKAGIALTVIGAAAFVALLAWGLTGSAQAQDGTATPTPAPETCSPALPTTFSGTVTVGGAPAPDGTVIKAIVGGIVWDQQAVANGIYVVDVPKTLPATPPCFAGGTATFEADGVACTETAQVPSGPKLSFNLTCAAVATATPPPATQPPATQPPATTVAPTATPKALPPTGFGSGSEGGFAWWPLALAAAALIAVAGLYTARRTAR